MSGDTPSVRAQAAALTLGVAALDYEALLDRAGEDPPELRLAVEGWRRDSGVAEDEAEYARQVMAAGRSREQRADAIADVVACGHAQATHSSELDARGLLDARGRGVALLRSAQTSVALAKQLSVGRTDPLYGSATAQLDRCVEIARETLDAELDTACRAALADLGFTELAPAAELYGQPRASSRLLGHPVVGPG